MPTTTEAPSTRRIRAVYTSSFLGGSHDHAACAATAPAPHAAASATRMPGAVGLASATTVTTPTGTRATSVDRCSSHDRAIPHANSRRASYSSIWYMRAATMTTRTSSASHAAAAAATTRGCRTAFMRSRHG
jgi:hypothetical protein